MVIPVYTSTNKELAATTYTELGTLDLSPIPLHSLYQVSDLFAFHISCHIRNMKVRTSSFSFSWPLGSLFYSKDALGCQGLHKPWSLWKQNQPANVIFKRSDSQKVIEVYLLHRILRNSFCIHFIAILILFWGFYCLSAYYFWGGLGVIAPSLWNSSIENKGNGLKLLFSIYTLEP